MDSLVTVSRPALVLVLDHPGIDYDTVLESLEDHLQLRHGQRQRPEGTPELCIWRALTDDREAVLDGAHLQLMGPSWFGGDAECYIQGLRTVSRMLPLEVEATGVNPVFEMRIISPEALDEVLRLGDRFLSAFPEGMCMHELVWCAAMPEGGHARFRLRLLDEPWRISVDCNWHMNHPEDGTDPLARWADFERQAGELSQRVLFAFAGE